MNFNLIFNIRFGYLKEQSLQMVLLSIHNKSAKASNTSTADVIFCYIFHEFTEKDLYVSCESSGDDL